MALNDYNLSQFHKSDARQVDLIRQDLLARMHRPNLFEIGAAAITGIIFGRGFNPLWRKISQKIGRELFEAFPEIQKFAGKESQRTISEFVISGLEKSFGASKKTYIGNLARGVLQSPFTPAVLSPVSYLAAKSVINISHPGGNYSYAGHIAAAGSLYLAASFANYSGLAKAALSFAEPLITKSFRQPETFAQALRGIREIRKEAAYAASSTNPLKKWFGTNIELLKRIPKLKPYTLYYREVLETSQRFENANVLQTIANLWRTSMPAFSKDYSRELKAFPKKIKPILKGLVESREEWQKFSKLSEVLGYQPLRIQDILHSPDLLLDLGYNQQFSDILAFLYQGLKETDKTLAEQFVKLPVGRGIVKKGSEVAWMPTLGQKFLETMTLFEKQFVIPYLDFSPISLLQPRLLKEYLYGQHQLKFIPEQTPLPLEISGNIRKTLLSQKLSPDKIIPYLSTFKPEIEKQLGTKLAGFAAFDRKLFGFTLKGEYKEIPKEIIPYASWISKANIPVSVIRAYSEEIGAFYRGTYEEFKLGGKAIGRLLSEEPEPFYLKKYSVIPRWHYAATETFFEKLQSTVLWPKEWKTIQHAQQESYEALLPLRQSKKAPDWFLGYLRTFTTHLGYLEDYEIPVQVSDELLHNFQDAFAGALTSKALTRGYLERRFLELKRAGSLSLDAVLPGTNINVRSYLTRLIAGYSGVFDILEKTGVENVFDKGTPRQIIRLFSVLDRHRDEITKVSKALFRRHEVEPYYTLRFFKEFVSGKVSQETLKGIPKELLGTNPYSFAVRSRRLQAVPPTAFKLRGFEEQSLAGFWGKFKEEFVTPFQSTTYIPFFTMPERFTELAEKIPFPFNLSKITQKLQAPFAGLFEWLSPSKKQYGRVNLASTLLHWAAERPIEVAEYAGLGGIKTTETFGFRSVFQRLFKDIVFPWTTIVGGIALADQLIDQLTPGPNNSPLGWMWAGLSNIYVGAVQVANVTGVGPLMRYMHKNFPGLVPAIASQYGYIGGGIIPAMTLGGVASFLEHIPTTREQVLEVEGIKNVPIKEGYGWEFGRTPFQGGRTMYHRPSTFYLERIGWEWTPLVYGNKLEYFFLGGRPPSIFNLFGLTQFLSPLHYEKKLQLWRPYVHPGKSALADIPFSELLSIAYPEQYAGIKILDSLRRNIEISHAKLGEAGFQGKASYALITFTSQTAGFLHSDINVQHAHDQLYIQQTLATAHELLNLPTAKPSLGNYLQEYLGILGFFGGTLFNPQGAVRPMHEQTSEWLSIEHAWYPRQLGNIFGLSEFFRRAYPRIETGSLNIGTTPNLMMATLFPWLPRRFLVGDPFASIDMGEVRLPGPTFAYTRGLVDFYGPVDILRVLSSVAPGSMQYNLAKKWALANLKSTDNLVAKYFTVSAIEEAEETYKREYNEYPFSRKVTTQFVKIGRYLGGGKFLTTQGQILALTNVNLNVDELAKHIFETEDVTLEEAYRKAKQQISEAEKYLGAVKEIPIITPKDKGLRYRMTKNGQIEMIGAIKPGFLPKDVYTTDNWLAIRAKYGSNIFKSLWEKFAHLTTFMHEKYIGVVSPLEEYERYYYYGTYTMLWQHPLKYIMAPSMLTMAENPLSIPMRAATLAVLGGATPEASIAIGAFTTMGGGVLTLMNLIHPIKPRSTYKIEDIEKEQIQLEYLKGQRNLLNLTKIPSPETLRKLLPRRFRNFTEYFVNAPERERRRILKLTPDYLRSTLEQIWEYKDAIAMNTPYQNAGFRVESPSIEKKIDYIAENPEMMAALNYLDIDKYTQLRAQVDVGDLRKAGWNTGWVARAQASLYDYSFLDNAYYSTARQVTNQILAQHFINLGFGQERTRYSVAPSHEEVTVAYEPAS